MNIEKLLKFLQLIILQGVEGFYHEEATKDTFSDDRSRVKFQLNY